MPTRIAPIPSGVAIHAVLGADRWGSEEQLAVTVTNAASVDLVHMELSSVESASALRFLCRAEAGHVSGR
ncbi:MAG TPA: hypothetical protein VFW03_13545 [Gemmatimonadaceae bacterium]|nr:hypothetical protein [Gemmatimonadaceae bacterium]